MKPLTVETQHSPSHYYCRFGTLGCIMDLTIEFRNDFRASARLLRLLVCSTSNKQSKILVPTLSQPVQSTLHRPNNVLGFSPPSPPPTHKVMLLPLKKKNSVLRHWHNTKVTLWYQTMQCQCHLHACAMGNLSSKHYCTPLSSAA